MNQGRRNFLFLVAGTILLLAMSLTARSQSANHKSTLAANEILNVNDALISDNGANQAILHPDCNIVVLNGGTQVWTSYHLISLQGASCFATMQADGNFVIYAGTPQQTIGPLWASGTNGPSPLPFFLRMQDDGNLVIYKGTATWATGTHGGALRSGTPTGRSTLAAGEALTAPDPLISYTDKYKASMQSDGDFVVRPAAGGLPISWHSGTSRAQGNYFATMQAAGFLALSTGTPQQPGSTYWLAGAFSPTPASFFLTMQDDGNLVIYRGNPIWSTAATGGGGGGGGGNPNTCSPPAIVCGGQCKGQPDPNNCGGCGVICGDLEFCEWGQNKITGQIYFACGPKGP